MILKVKIFISIFYVTFFICMSISASFVLAEEKGELITYHFLSKPITLVPNVEGKRTFSTNVSFFVHSSIRSFPKLIIDYEFSSLNHMQTGVVILLDGQPIYTLRASPEQLNNQTKGTVVIPIPQVDGNKRMYRFEFIAGTGKNEKVCEKKYGNEWIVIKSSSRIEINYEKRENVNVTLKHFPWSLQTPKEEPIFIVIPDRHTKEDDTLFIQTVSFLSRRLSLQPNDIRTVMESEFYMNPMAQNVLFVGMYDHFQERTKKMFRHLLHERETEGDMLVATRSPFHSWQFFYALFSTSFESGQYMNKMLNRQAFLDSLNSQFIKIEGKEHSAPSKAKSENVKSIIKINEIGYKDGLVIKNVQTQATASFRLKLEPGVRLEDESQLVIYYSYNDTFSEERSTLTVSINHIPVSTVPLKRGEGERKSIKVKIPIAQLEQQHIMVDLTFTFKEKDEDCNDVLRTDGWIRVFPDTYFELAYKNRELSNLNFFPYPLLKNFQWNNVEFVLPTSATSSYYEQIANIVMLLGKYVQKDDNGLYLLREHELGNVEKNIIMYQPSLKFKKDMEQQIGEKFKEFEDEDRIILSHLASKEAKFFMLVRSQNPQLLSRSYELFRVDEWREKATTVDNREIRMFIYNASGERMVIADEGKESRKIIPLETKTVMASYIWNKETLKSLMQFLLIVVTIMLIVRIWFEKKTGE